MQVFKRIFRTVRTHIAPQEATTPWHGPVLQGAAPLDAVERWTNEGGARKPSREARPPTNPPVLRVQLTLLGDVYALRFLAKERGYRFQQAQWRKELSDAVTGARPEDLDLSWARLLTRLRLERQLFAGQITIDLPVLPLRHGPLALPPDLQA